MNYQNNTSDFQEFLSNHTDILSAFKKASHSRIISKGHVIVGQGDSDTDLYFLNEGRAKVVIYSEGGNEIHLADFEAGTLFGEMALLLNTSRSSNVVAQMTCQFDIISANDFNALIRRFPDLALFVTQMLASRLKQTSQSLFEGLVFTVPQRAYEYLLRRAEQNPKDEEAFHLAPAPTVTSLSESLNVSREATSRAVNKLITQGLLKKESTHWKIICPNFAES